MIDCSFRPVTKKDTAILIDMLQYAIYGESDNEFPSVNVQHRSLLRYYVEDWGHEDDIGFIAFRKTDIKCLGAAWIRRLSALTPRPIFIVTNLPELMIAVHPGYRGLGIGTELLAHLLNQLNDKFRTIALSVEPHNPALRLYQRFGFEVVGISNNRLVMHLQIY